MAASTVSAGEQVSGSLISSDGTGVNELRNRSRSIQLINSEFIHKVDDIPIVHNTVDYVLSAYDVIKDVNPVVKSSLERSEDLGYWLRRKAEYVVTATKLDAPLKRLDAAAADGVVRVEKGSEDVLRKFHDANKGVESMVRDGSIHLRKRAGDVRYSFYDSIQTFLDLLEDRLEPVMLEPSPEAVKFAHERNFYVTTRRTLDLTYRLNLGILRYSARRAKEVLNAEAWAESFEKHFSPEKIRLRANIIYRETFAPAGRELRYMEDEDLTELDRTLIALSRYIVETTKALGEGLRGAPSKASLMALDSLQYVWRVLSHLSEARSLNDLLGIGFNETRLAIEGAQDRVPLFNRFGLLDSTVQWMMAQEKTFNLN